MPIKHAVIPIRAQTRRQCHAERQVRPVCILAVFGMQAPASGSGFDGPDRVCYLSIKQLMSSFQQVAPDHDVVPWQAPQQNHECLACRHWPVIVSSVDRLPQSVAAGGSLHCGGDSVFPLRLSEASSNGRPELALPVMALGTQVGCPSALCLSAPPVVCACQLCLLAVCFSCPLPEGVWGHLKLGNMLCSCCCLLRDVFSLSLASSMRAGFWQNTEQVK